MAYEIRKLQWRQANGYCHYLDFDGIPYIVADIVKAPEAEAYFLTIGPLGSQFKWEHATYPYPTPEAAMQKAQELYEWYVKSFLVEVPGTQ